MSDSNQIARFALLNYWVRGKKLDERRIDQLRKYFVTRNK